jgi:hypothetical protein
MSWVHAPVDPRNSVGPWSTMDRIRVPLWGPNHVHRFFILWLGKIGGVVAALWAAQLNHAAVEMRGAIGRVLRWSGAHRDGPRRGRR